ncbi:MAG: phosphatase PAP2 family protein [Bacteroidales bacterium]|nr:phosphatase PAP2 family protein [Bacteroidales bacterium]
MEIAWPGWDTDALLWVNAQHTPWLDQLMLFVSGRAEWIPLYLILLYLLYRKFGWRMWLSLVFIALLVTLTDQLSVKAFKDVFLRLRPCHEPALDGLVRILNGKCGGEYGFVSSHAANTFGLATFLSLIFRKPWITAGLFCWAALVSYSRVYLGVHYPLDVMVGALLGTGLGAAVFVLFQKLYKRGKRTGETSEEKNIEYRTSNKE